MMGDRTKNEWIDVLYVKWYEEIVYTKHCSNQIKWKIGLLKVRKWSMISSKIIYVKIKFVPFSLRGHQIKSRISSVNISPPDYLLIVHNTDEWILLLLFLRRIDTLLCFALIWHTYRSISLMRLLITEYKWNKLISVIVKRLISMKNGSCECEF